jgi:uncharacterized protein
MAGETSLDVLLKNLEPSLQEGDYVFCTVQNINQLDPGELLLIFKEKEGITIIVKRDFADCNALTYSSIMAWITLMVHSSLDAVGLTAAFAAALTKEGISCNVMAGFYHDHIFVAKGDAEKAMQALLRLAKEAE